VEGAQVARGYHQPDGTFVPFHGKKATGDQAEFDGAGRLKITGKASDRITTQNGLNYNPTVFEEELLGMDLEEKNWIEEVVIIGDAQPSLGGVFFLREGVASHEEGRAYVESLVRAFNAARAVDERLGPWALHDGPLKEAGFIGPTGKMLRRRVEETYVTLFGPTVEVTP
jgi:long-subunit acyl-CoA synthetase (AMP-forming)